MKYFTRALMPVEKPMTANAQVRKSATRRCVRRAVMSCSSYNSADEKREENEGGRFILLAGWSVCQLAGMAWAGMGIEEPSTEAEKREKRERRSI